MVFTYCIPIKEILIIEKDFTAINLISFTSEIVTIFFENDPEVEQCESVVLRPRKDKYMMLCGQIRLLCFCRCRQNAGTDRVLVLF